MEALILSCGTGGGHNSAGKAIMEELRRRNHNAVMLNPYNLRSKKLAGYIDNAYIALRRKYRVFSVQFTVQVSFTENCRFALPFTL